MSVMRERLVQAVRLIQGHGDAEEIVDEVLSVLMDPTPEMSDAAGAEFARGGGFDKIIRAAVEVV